MQVASSVYTDTNEARSTSLLIAHVPVNVRQGATVGVAHRCVMTDEPGFEEFSLPPPLFSGQRRRIVQIKTVPGRPAVFDQFSLGTRGMGGLGNVPFVFFQSRCPLSARFADVSRVTIPALHFVYDPALTVRRGTVLRFREHVRQGEMWFENSLYAQRTQSSPNSV